MSVPIGMYNSALFCFYVSASPILPFLLSLRNFPGSFLCDSHVVAVHDENLYTVEPNKLQIRTLQVWVHHFKTVA